MKKNCLAVRMEWVKRFKRSTLSLHLHITKPQFLGMQVGT